MSEYALIHTATRVVKSISSKYPDWTIPDEHSIVEVPHLSLANPPWKLNVDNETLSKPTAQELKDSYTTARDRARWALRDKLVALSAASASNTKLQEFLSALRSYWDLDRDVNTTPV